MLQMETILEENNYQMEKMRERMEIARRDFRKYEEEAQLEILSLKEKIDAFADEIKQKHNELQMMAEKYLNLEEQNKTILQQAQMYKNKVSANNMEMQ